MSQITSLPAGAYFINFLKCQKEWKDKSENTYNS